MKIKDLHKDMDRYLRQDCYCQNEVYDLGGFFYMIVNQEDETKKIYEKDDVILAIWQDQILVITLEKDKIYDVQRLDATENNIKEVKRWLDNDRNVKVKLDEHVKGATKKSYDELLSIADGIIIS